MTEVPRILRTYGRAVALILRRPDGDRFNVTAFGTKSGSAYGRDEWIWDPQCKAFRPHGDPLVPRLHRYRLMALQKPVESLLPPVPVHEIRTAAPPTPWELTRAI